MFMFTIPCTKYGSVLLSWRDQLLREAGCFPSVERVCSARNFGRFEQSFELNVRRLFFPRIGLRENLQENYSFGCKNKGPQMFF